MALFFPFLPVAQQNSLLTMVKLHEIRKMIAKSNVILKFQRNLRANYAFMSFFYYYRANNSIFYNGNFFGRRGIITDNEVISGRSIGGGGADVVASAPLQSLSSSLCRRRAFSERRRGLGIQYD